MEKAIYCEVCTCEERRGIGWWKVGNWRLEGMMGNVDQGMCVPCMQKRGRTGSHL
jgi:hypothetical protein